MWGQCVDQYGSGEPYLPIIEALRRPCAEPEGERIVQCLRHNARAWLAHIAPPSSPDATTELSSTSVPLMPERVLGQMVEALEALSAQNGTVLLIEDLHWADCATLDLFAYVAQRSDPARLLVIGTYRPIEAAASRLADVEQALRARRACVSVPVPRLSQSLVREYLERRFTQHDLPVAVPALLYGRTEGNALFMTGVVDSWLERGLLTTIGGRCETVASLDELVRCVPDSFVRMIHRALERLSPLERSAIEAASVVGNCFSTDVVAAALSLDALQVEELCMRWVHRGQFLSRRGKTEWRDGTVAERCEFVHALYQQVIYEQIGAARQAQLHLRTGERLEAAHAEQANIIATELALHFQRGRDYRRAVRYLRISGEHALRQGAYDAAVDHLTRAIDLTAKLPEAEDKAGIELDLRCLIATPLRITKGFAAPEVEQSYVKAAQLCDGRGSTPQLFIIMAGMCTIRILRGAIAAAVELGEKFLGLAEEHGDRSALSEAHLVLGIARHSLGQHREAGAHLEYVIAAADAEGQSVYASLGGRHPVVAAQCFLALSSCMLGYLDRAQREAQGALSLARGLEDPFAIGFASSYCSHVCHLRGEPESTQKHLDALATLSAEYGLGMLSSMELLQRGGACIQAGDPASGIELIQRGSAEFEATGARAYARYWVGLLAQGYAKIAQPGRALQIIDDAIQQQNPAGERLWDAELLRIQGELLISLDDCGGLFQEASESRERTVSAEGSLLRALEVARQQEAKLFELRAAVVLAKYWQARGNAARAYALLFDIYGWFSEALETADLVEARLLVEDLARSLPKVAARSDIRAR